MKILSTVLGATALLALAGCNSGGEPANNVQANAVDANAVDANATAPADNAAAPADNVAAGKPVDGNADAGVPAGKPTGDAPAEGSKPPADAGNEQ